MKKVLDNPPFLGMVASDLLSNFGDVLYYMALMNYVLFLPQPNLALAIITVSETLPSFSRLFMGAWSDKTKNKLGMIQLTLVIRTALFILLGCVMAFEPALWIIIVAALINFSCDMLAQYENGLFIPLQLRVMPEEDRSTYMAFSQSAMQLGQILFLSSGAYFIAIMSYTHLAWINALTFLASLLIVTWLKPGFEALTQTQPLAEDNSDTALLISIWQNLRQAFTLLKDQPQLKLAMIVIPFINSLASVLPTLMTLVMSQNSDFIIQTPAATLAAINTIGLIGNILGALLVMNLFKNLQLNTIMLFSAFQICLIALAIYLQNIWLVLLFLFPLCLVTGASNPQLNALIFNSLPESGIATVSGGITTYFQIGNVAMRLLVSGLMLFLPTSSLLGSLLLLCLGFLGYTMYKVKQQRT